jgi:hypothetical protein
MPQANHAGVGTFDPLVENTLIVDQKPRDTFGPISSSGLREQVKQLKLGQW